MRTVTAFFVSIWLLSLPFYNISIWRTLSVDNILAPIAFAFSTLLLFSSPRLAGKANLLVCVGFFYVFFAIGYLLSVADSHTYLQSASLQIAKYAVYFFTPILFVRSIRDVRIVAKMLAAAAILAGVSAFLVSLGFLELAVSRTSPGRLSFIGLPKSIGLMGNYGDVAMLFAATWILMRVFRAYNAPLASRPVEYLVLGALVIGFLGSQSRNIALTFLASASTYFALSLTVGKTRGRGLLMPMLLVLLLVAVPGVVVVSDVNLVEEVSNWGGQQARGTAEDRVSQYQYALRLILENPFLGDGEAIARSGMQIHNIWLNVAANGGVVAGLGLLGMMLCCFATAFIRMLRDKSKGMGLASMSIFVATAIATEFYVGLTYTFFIVLGTALVMPLVSFEKSNGPRPGI